MKAIILCLLLFSCYPEIPREKEIKSCYWYNIMLVRNNGKMIQEFYANGFQMGMGGILHVWDTSLDNREHYFIKSDDVMIEIIKLK